MSATTTRLLAEYEFRATLAEPMENITGQESDVLEIWPYVDAVPISDLQGHIIHDRFVEYVYRTPDARFDHVLVMTKTKNVYLAVVVDLEHDAIHGHHLLDLNRLYGIMS
jgi:hypothetical protein